MSVYVMDSKSDYFHGLTAASKTRYETKILSTGLKVDPYSISTWVVNSEEFPEVNLSDMVMYMISTPSPYTHEEIKVGHHVAVYTGLQYHITEINRPGKVCSMERTS